MSFLTEPWLCGVALHLWQATLFGLAVALLIVVVPRTSARARHVVAGLALARFVVPTSLFVWLSGLLRGALPGSGWLASHLGGVWMPAFVVSGESGERLGHGVPWAAWILAAVWAAGAAAVAGASLTRLVRGLRAVAREQVSFTTAEQERLDALAERAGLRRGAVRGFTVDEDAWLGVVGLFRSRVLVPRGLFSALDEAEVDAVLLHELMHVRRRDNLVRLLQAGAVALLWFHPLVWWLDRRMRWESERACDDGVLRVTGANTVYASGLFKATRYALGLALPGVSGMSRYRLRTRIEAVLNHQPQKDSFMKLVLLLGSVLGLVGIAALMAAPEDDSSQPAVVSSSAQGGDVLSVAQLDRAPTVRHAEQPLYPKELKEQKRTGKVVVAVVIDKEGEVKRAEVVDSTDHAFDASALAAVRQWTFTPGTHEGKPVNVRIEIPIVYSLTK